MHRGSLREGPISSSRMLMIKWACGISPINELPYKTLGLVLDLQKTYGITCISYKTCILDCFPRIANIVWVRAYY